MLKRLGGSKALYILQDFCYHTLDWEEEETFFFPPWPGTLSRKAANSAALGQTQGRNSGLLPPVPVVKIQHNGCRIECIT